MSQTSVSADLTYDWIYIRLGLRVSMLFYHKNLERNETEFQNYHHTQFFLDRIPNDNLLA